MHAEVFLLGYPNVRFRGRVEGVGWALFQDNGATVEGLPRVEPTLNWLRLAQRFAMRATRFVWAKLLSLRSRATGEFRRRHHFARCSSDHGFASGGIAPVANVTAAAEINNSALL